jgi:hypothetical protein
LPKGNPCLVSSRRAVKDAMKLMISPLIFKQSAAENFVKDFKGFGHTLTDKPKMKCFP